MTKPSSDEMAQMTEAALAFARDEANKEELRPVDLGGLLESLLPDEHPQGAERLDALGVVVGSLRFDHGAPVLRTVARLLLSCSRWWRRS